MLNQLLIYIVLTTSLYLLISLSFSIIYNATKVFHIAHAVVITTAAYITYLFAELFLLPTVASIFLGIVVATSIGILCDVVVYRPMRNKMAPAWAFLVASMGVYTVIQNCVSLLFGDDTKVITTGKVAVGYNILGAYITTIQLLTLCASGVLFVVVTLFLTSARTGKLIRAVSSNRELCRLYGVNSNCIIAVAFGIGSALAAIAGIFSAMDTNMTPTFGFNLLVYGMAAMVIGGVGNMRGLFRGALLVATSQHLAAYYLDTRWMDAVAYFILILFLILKPHGFSGNHLRKVEI